MISIRPLRTGFLTAALLLLPVLAPTAGAQGGSRHLLSGERSAVYNLAGTLTVRGGEVSEVTVEVTRMGPDAERLTVESGVLGGRNTLRVIYPDDRVIYPEVGRFSSTTVRVRRDGTFGGSWGSSRSTTIRGGGRGLEAWADITITVPAGRDVEAYIGAGEVDASDVRGDLRLDTHSGNVTAAGIRGRLVIDTGSGRVSVTDTEGDLSVDTGSGRVTLTAVRGGEVLVDTGSGRVNGSEITARRVDVDTGSGAIALDRLRADHIRCDTGSGGVELGLLNDVRDLEVDTGSGAVLVYVPEVINAEIEVDTGSGGIDIDLPVEYRRKSRSYVLGTIGDGSGRIYIDTGSGGIRIRRK